MKQKTMSRRVERVQIGARMEKTLVKTLKALAEYLDLSLGDLLEGITLHALEGKSASVRKRSAISKNCGRFTGLISTRATAIDWWRKIVPSNDETTDLLADFEAGRVDPQFFPHRAHVEVSYQLLERHAFPEALLHLARGLRRLAAKTGKPEVYHETITAAFLALIAERRLRGQYADWEDFAEQNP